MCTWSWRPVCECAGFDGCFLLWLWLSVSRNCTWAVVSFSMPDYSWRSVCRRESEVGMWVLGTFHKLALWNVPLKQTAESSALIHTDRKNSRHAALFIKCCIETIWSYDHFSSVRSCDSENERTHKKHAYASLPDVKSIICKCFIKIVRSFQIA